MDERIQSAIIEYDYTKILSWMFIENRSDLYKFCVLTKYLRKKYNSKYVVAYLQDCCIRYFDSYKVIAISKYLMEYYKGKTLAEYRSNGFIEIILSDYSMHLFGELIGIHTWLEQNNLNNEKIKFLLNFARCYIFQKHDIHDNKFIKFIIECKKLDYPKKEIIKKLKILEEDYDNMDIHFLNFADNYSKYNYKAYPLYRHISTATLDCVSYLLTLRETAIDLNAEEITISLDSLNQLLESDNVKEYIDSLR